MGEHGEIFQVLSSRLISLEELGDLADVTVTARVNGNGRTHAPHCRWVSAKATGARLMTIAELRGIVADWEACGHCGGGVLNPLSEEQRNRAETLIPVREARAEAARNEKIARRRAAEDKRVADAIDKRAQDILSGWEWTIEEERKHTAGYPEGPVFAHVPCRDCGASAVVTLEPRELRITYACPRDPMHGYYRLKEEEDPAPEPIWPYFEAGYVGRELVAPVLAGSDDTWQRVYGTRASDYRATVEALEEFDAAHPEPMRLTPDIRCGDCGKPLSSHPGNDRFGATYGCSTRHDDGRYRSFAKADVDRAIDSQLVRILRSHPSWASAPELEPSPEALAEYAEYLDAKIALYDAHIGAAAEDARLAARRRTLGSQRELVGAMWARGTLAAAELSGPGARHERYLPDPELSDLARALLTDHVEVTEMRTIVHARFGEGTALHRSLRIREIREELADLERRQRELTAELDELGSSNPSH